MLIKLDAKLVSFWLPTKFFVLKFVNSYYFNNPKMMRAMM